MDVEEVEFDPKSLAELRDTHTLWLRPEFRECHTVEADKVDAAAIAAFKRDGVEICKAVRDGIGFRHTSAVLQRVVGNIGNKMKQQAGGGADGADGAAPTGDAHFGLMGKNGGWMDKGMWKEDTRFKQLAMDSLVPSVVTAVKQGSRLNLMYDHLIVKEPNNIAPTLDQPFWPVEGDDVVSVWIPFDESHETNGRLEFVQGSHRLLPQHVLNKPTAFVSDGAAESPVGFQVLTNNQQPGDAFIFHGKTLHFSRGNFSKDRRRAVSLRYAGDDCRFAPQKQMVKWELSTHSLPLLSGDRMSCELFPLVIAPESEVQEFGEFMKARKALKGKVAITMPDGVVRKGRMHPWDKVKELADKLELKPEMCLVKGDIVMQRSSAIGSVLPQFGEAAVYKVEDMNQSFLHRAAAHRSKAADLSSPVAALASGCTIPRVGLGLYKVPPSDTGRVVTEALAAGYRHFDTAALYQNEGELGQALADSGIAREELFVTTKLPPGAGVEQALRSSLELLQLDYVDLYLIHAPGGRKGRNEKWAQMEAVLAAGLTRAIGVHHLNTLFEHCVVKPSVNQIELSPFLQRDDIIELCDAHGVVVEAYSPLCKASRLQDPRITMLASQHQCSPAQVLLRWGLQRGFVVLPKTTRVERMAENLSALCADFALTDEEMSIMSRWDENFVTGWDPTAEE